MLLTSRHESPLSDEQEIKEMFSLIDKDRSGSIETNVGFILNLPFLIIFVLDLVNRWFVGCLWVVCVTCLCGLFVFGLFV